MVHFSVQFKESTSNFNLQFTKSISDFKVEFGAITVVPKGETYSGPYDITPTIDLQTLATGQKFLKYDMTVKAIPYYDVGNLAGGSTVYIGNEVE